MRLHPLAPDPPLSAEITAGCTAWIVPPNAGAHGQCHAKKIGDIGFPIVLHRAIPKRCGVFPMDGGTVWPRVSPGWQTRGLRFARWRPVVRPPGQGPSDQAGLVHT